MTIGRLQQDSLVKALHQFVEARNLRKTNPLRAAYLESEAIYQLRAVVAQMKREAA